jgi:hypothetical protein
MTETQTCDDDVSYLECDEIFSDIEAEIKNLRKIVDTDIDKKVKEISLTFLSDLWEEVIVLPYIFLDYPV